MRLALIVGRDMGPENTWGMVVAELLGAGHEIVAGAQPLPERFGSRAAQLAHEVFPRDIVTDGYLSTPIEAGAPSRLSEYFAGPHYPQTHSVLMGMLSRRDSTGTFRTVDRDIVLRRLQLALLSQLLRAAPTHVVFEETPHEVADFALLRLAEWLEIPVLFFQPSLVGPQVVSRTSLTDVLEVACRLIGPTELTGDRRKVQEISLHAIAKLQTGGGTALLDRQKRVDRVSSAPFQRVKVVRHLLRRVRQQQSNRQVNFTGHRFLGEGVRRALEVVFEWSLRKSLVRAVLALPKEPAGRGAPFALFALHYEPERTNMPEGLPYLSQVDAVLEARRFLPAEVTLLVKEHYAQQSSSLRGYVGRSPLAYEYLSSIPGIEVLGVGADSRALMKDAECVFTMTGKIGIEAAFAGTPAVFFGQPWWGHMPGSFAFDSASTWVELKKAKMPSESVVDKWFADQVSGSLLVGLGGTSPEKYSTRISQLPDGYEKLEAQSILAALGAFAG